MIKVNGTEITELKYKGIDIEKVICNGIVVFEKKQNNSKVTFKINDPYSNPKFVKLKTTDGSPVKMYQGDTEIATFQSGKRKGVLFENGKEYILKKCEKVRYLNFDNPYGNNRLTELNIQDLPNLQKLYCENGQLTKLNIQGFTNLQELWCSKNQLTGLNVQGLTNLQKLHCSENYLTKLNVQGFTNLQELICYENQLTKLNVQGLTNLQKLHCSENYLTKLNAQGLTNLQQLGCYDNRLTELNIQGLTNLQELYCNENYLTKQTFIALFNNLPEEQGRAILYSDYRYNFKDYTSTSDIATAFQNAKNRGWRFYKNYISSSNKI